MKKTLVLFLVLMTSVLSLPAEVKLSAVFSDNITDSLIHVLQINAYVY
jgi:hypothetical protein